MSNEFSKQEIVLFNDLLPGFDESLVMTGLVSTFNTNATQMEQSDNTIWRPMPYIVSSYDGTDQTANFKDYTQLSVPSSFGYAKSTPLQLTSTDLLDPMRERELYEAALQRLASDVDQSIINQACNFGSIVITRTAAAAGYADISPVTTRMDMLGLEKSNRKMVMAAEDYEGLAADLAGRQTLQGKTQTAYETGFVGTVDSLKLYKTDISNRLDAATATGVTMNGANQYYTPVATSVAATGEKSNVDNRFQNIDITVGGGTVAVGDCFTIAGVNAVHHIRKTDIGKLKTFRVTAIISGAGGTGTIQITPPIISNGGSTQAEASYQNVTATPTAAAAITFLNVADAYINPFFMKKGIELLPARYAIPANTGLATMKGSLKKSGLEVVMTKSTDINTHLTKIRVDVRWGVVMTNTEMCGIELFGQT